MARYLFQPSRKLYALAMELIALSDFPYWSHVEGRTKPLVALRMPGQLEMKTSVGEAALCAALVAVCKAVGAASAFVATFNHHTGGWVKEFRSKLKEANVNLIILHIGRGWQRNEFTTTGKPAAYSKLLALSLADVFIGDPAWPSDRLIHRLVKGRELARGERKPMTLQVRCGQGLVPFDWRPDRASHVKPWEVKDDAFRKAACDT
mmetsp:Transcript_1185/g.2262  ORF Transcript_1185/g.2262 Transcript_1185/m.2262 type:complete len:206 (-) Transcript_1185:168-785(-)